MKDIESILAYIDLDSPPDNEPGVARAIELARERGARLTLVSVMEDVPAHARFLLRNAKHLDELVRKERHEQLEQLCGVAREEGVEAEHKLVDGRATRVLIEEVIRNGHDLLVSDVHPSTGLGRLLGSLDRRLLRACPCPVLLARQPGEARTRRLLACIDAFTEVEEEMQLNERILDAARDFARLDGSEFHVAFSWSLYGEDTLRAHSSVEEIDAMVSEASDEARLALEKALAFLGNDLESVHRHLPKGGPGKTIPVLVRQLGVDLVVMGTVARTGLAGVLVGNTAESILDELDCSILALKPEGFATHLEEEGESRELSRLGSFIL